VAYAGYTSITVAGAALGSHQFPSSNEEHTCEDGL